MLAGGLHAIAQLTALVGVVVKLFAQVPPGDFAFVEERLPATVELPRELVVRVEFDDLGDRASQKLAVVAHDRETTPPSKHEIFEPRQPIEVEIVRRLVEQQDVVTTKQDGGKRGPRHLPAR